MSTTIQVRVTGTADPEDELRSLLRWLKADDEVGPSAHGVLAGSAPPHPEHMGTLLDIISLTVASGLSATQLAVAIGQWRTTRRRTPDVTLRRGDTEVTVTGADAGTVRALAELMAEPGREERPDDGGTA
ncbi:hypothetical protein [Streptomyces sp. NPDC050848]|uniref:effector-associated constant component EACC1 n=1 Tax=Streptomyces sp. NPDC050848 TaxID=3155791 RepID=UPI0033DEAFB2